jgi:hypothetical protein
VCLCVCARTRECVCAYVCVCVCTVQCSKWKFESAGILLKSKTSIYRQKLMEKDNWVWHILIHDFICIPNVLLQLDTVLLHSLHSRCSLNLPFLSKVWSTCGITFLHFSSLSPKLELLHSLHSLDNFSPFVFERLENQPYGTLCSQVFHFVPLAIHVPSLFAAIAPSSSMQETFEAHSVLQTCL